MASANGNRCAAGGFQCWFIRRWGFRLEDLHLDRRKHPKVDQQENWEEKLEQTDSYIPKYPQIGYSSWYFCELQSETKKKASS